MSYQALARTWRPRAFDQLVGQDHVRRALVHALDAERLHHAYLFTGTRGVGKTTIARIFAKSLNCETGVTSTPCGECSACRDIDDGRFVDLLEVDAASRTKVDDTRELLENVQYTPARGRYKVYLIDEVHMLSSHSFNALLKTLEEPPPHVKFLLATTDPQKLPVTVLSRCLQFNLKRLPETLILERLQTVCEQETMQAEPEALALIADAADGSMRDALSLLDQAAAYCDGQLAVAEVSAMLGTIDRQHVARLLRLLADGDAAGLMAAVAAMDEHVPDYGAALDALASLVQRVAIAQAVADAPAGTDAATVTELAAAIPAEDLQLYYQIALMSKRDLELAPSPRCGFEMALLRMHSFRPALGESSAPPSAPPTARPASAAKTPSAAAGAASRAVSGGAARAAGQQAVKREPAKTRQASEPAPSPAPAPAPTPANGARGEWRDPDWPALVAALDLGGMARQLAANCVYRGREGNVLDIALDAGHQHLKTDALCEKLRAALEAFYGEPLKVRISVAADDADTPARQQNRRNEARQQAAVDSILSDPNVKAMQERFGATVDADTIRPRD